MSAIIASSLVINDIDGIDVENTVSKLDLPDVVKASVTSNLKSYLEAIKIDGYEGKKKRKVFIFGNTSKLLGPLQNIENIEILIKVFNSTN